jgi:transposase
MWLKNRVNWAEKEAQKWESMALERCVTGMAYQMRLVLQGIYERKDAGEARKLFRNWCACVHTMRGQTGELLEPMARAARMVEGHLEGILAHWTRGLTTAFMEGLNSLFPAVKRKARGYRTVEYMTAMLYFVAGKLTLPCYGPTENSDELYQEYTSLNLAPNEQNAGNDRKLPTGQRSLH